MGSSIQTYSAICAPSYTPETSLSCPPPEAEITEYLEPLSEFPQTQRTSNHIFTLFDFADNEFDGFAMSTLETTASTSTKDKTVQAEEGTMQLPHAIPILEEQEDDGEKYRFSAMPLSITSPPAPEQGEMALTKEVTILPPRAVRKKKYGAKRRRKRIVAVRSASKEKIPKCLTTQRGRYIVQYLEELVKKTRCADLFVRDIYFFELYKDYKKWVDAQALKASGYELIMQILPYANIHLTKVSNVYKLVISGRENCLEAIEKTKEAIEKYDRNYENSPIALYITKSMSLKLAPNWNFAGTILAADLYTQFETWRNTKKQGRRSPEDFIKQFTWWLPCASLSEDGKVFSIPSLKRCQTVFQQTIKQPPPKNPHKKTRRDNS
jgi:hypothetical protein